MRNLYLIVSCLLVAGCSRGTAGSLPIHGFDSSVEREFSPNAATFRSVYSFKNTPDGLSPSGRMSEINGTFYGTTQGGGTYGDGTIFRVRKDGQEVVLHSFAGSDGKLPYSGLTQSNGVLYGTTYYGGAANCNCGEVFQLIPPDMFSVIYSFGTNANDGVYPIGSPIDVNGTLYGTTFQGGTTANCESGYGCGTVYEITPTGSESVLYSFKGTPDAGYPLARLLDINGTLYGTTGVGGTSNLGSVFALAPDGTETVLHSFTGGQDGWFPESALIDVDGTLYGTTKNGGPTGYGTVFKISISGNESVVYNFLGNSDGANPASGLIYVKGNLYGTTTSGYGGTVFKLSTSGTETVLFLFTHRFQGESPDGGLNLEGGWLYGTTPRGGDYGEGYGTVFKVAL